VAFYAYPKLKKVSVSGGAPAILADAGGFRGAAWLPDDTIVYAPTNNSGLYRIRASATSGQAKPEVFTKLDTAKGERGQRWPTALPGGKAVLFTSLVGSSFVSDDGQIVAQPLDGGERRMLVQGAAQALFAPASPGASDGYLVYASRAGLMAAPFDAARLELRGTVSSVLDGVMLNLTYGIGHFGVSGDGSLVYLAGGTQETSRRLVWVDRKGLAKPVAEKRGYFHDPRLSPDGKRLAVNLLEGRNDLWVYELEREALSRLTFEADNHWHAWSPDGKRIAFGSDKSGAMNLYWKPADGSGPEERLTTSENVQIVTAWSPDGRTLAFTERNPISGSDLYVLPLEGERKPQELLKTRFNEGGAAFSPDGRWIAYWSDQTGRPEIYVQPFPGPGGKWQVSTDGGVEPVWGGGGEVFYRNGDKMMVVEVQTKPSFAASRPKVLFEGRYTLSPGLIPYYDVTRDGQRFVMVKDDETLAATQLRVVLNWVEELRQKRAGRAQ
jgi:serine/threonine-protein kinase